MTSTSASTLENVRPASIPWASMPTWFHLATFVYFATNVFNGWAVVYLKAPLIPTVLTLFGLIGGFIEHTSPYFPKLYVSPMVEKLVFRLPTVIGIFWAVLSAGLAWYVVAILSVQGIIFMREKPLTSMEPRFHMQHVFVTHLFGSVQVYLIILLVTGKLPALSFLLAR
jgi:hypothetical protein